MYNIKRLYFLLIPASIFGFSLFWWRRKKAIQGKTEVVEDEVVIDETSSMLCSEKEEIPVVDEKPQKPSENLILEDDSIIKWCLATDNSSPTPTPTKKPVVEDTIIITSEIMTHSEPCIKDFEMHLDSLPTTPPKSAASSTDSERVRHQSSCDADSAFVEDYSSDTISISSSTDNAIKSPNANLDNDILEEAIHQQFRNWYGPALQSVIDEEEEHLNWGNIPMSDTEYNLEDMLCSLSSSTTNDDNNHTRSDGPKRRERKSSPKKSPKKTRKRDKSNSKQEETYSQSPRRSRSPKKNSRRKSDRDGIEGSWREQSDANENADLTVRSYDYEFPEEFCGRLIGKSGKHVAEIKNKTGASICIEPEMKNGNRVVSITGNSAQIEKAKKMLNGRFNNKLVLIHEDDISSAISSLQFTSLSMDDVPECIVTAIVDAGHFFVQIFDEDVDANIVWIQQELAACYTSPRSKYLFTEPPKIDEYCIGFIDYTWCRLKVLDLLPDNQVVVSFVDYGGNVTVPLEILLKIRADFLTLPVQAIECHLADVTPNENEENFSYGATNVFSQLVEGKALQTVVTGYQEDIPCVEFTYLDQERGEMICVNTELTKWGLVQAVVV